MHYMMDLIVFLFTTANDFCISYWSFSNGFPLVVPWFFSNSCNKLLFPFHSRKTYLLWQKQFIAIEHHVNNRNSFSYEKQKGPISFSRSNPKWKQRQSDNRNILTRNITRPSFIISLFHWLLSLAYYNPITTYVNSSMC